MMITLCFTAMANTVMMAWFFFFFSMSCSAVASASAASATAASNNMNPLQYQIANSIINNSSSSNKNNNKNSNDSDKVFLTNFHNAEYFEVYTPMIRTRYSEVYWKTLETIMLPEHIRTRFDNRTMAIVGLEVDQVYYQQERDNNNNNKTTTTNNNNTTNTNDDVSVPITYTYCRHYNAWLINSHYHATKNATEDDDDHEHEHDHDDCEVTRDVPLVQSFSSGNGGEFRTSYKGYPKGYAQLIHSPDTFRVTVFQIDTWNRETMVNNNPKYFPGPLPKSSQDRIDNNNTTANGLVGSPTMSGLIECPCSDRVIKEQKTTYRLVQPDWPCASPIETASECFMAASTLLPTGVASSSSTKQKIVDHDETILHDKSTTSAVPNGCSIELMKDGTTNIHWNKPQNKNTSTELASRGGFMESNIDSSSRLSGKVQSNNWIAKSSTNNNDLDVTVELDLTKKLATITMVAEADRWFGVAFGAHSMCLQIIADECSDYGGPNAIIVSGDDVMERVLDYHGMGRLIETSVTVRSNTVGKNGNRTIVLSRSMVGKTDDHYSFDFASLGASWFRIPIITAVGCDLSYTKHCEHEISTLSFGPDERFLGRTITTVCRTGSTSTINGRLFDNDGSRCSSGELSNQKNPTCDIDSYAGGLMCCNHGMSLLDSSQVLPWSDQYLEYQMKFRFYFEEYNSKVEEEGKQDVIMSPNEVGALNTLDQEDTNMSRFFSKPSHQSLVPLEWTTTPNEYDTPVCSRGVPLTQCLHVLTSRFQIKDLLNDCPVWPDASICAGADSLNAKGIKLIYASAHCHASGCYSMELYNADTGQLICGVDPIVGQSDTTIFDERGFLSLPPCLWSENEDDGLSLPELLSLNTTLMSITRVNTSYAHTGEMTRWQMRGIVVSKDSSLPPVPASDCSNNKNYDKTKNRPRRRDVEVGRIVDEYKTNSVHRNFHTISMVGKNDEVTNSSGTASPSDDATSDDAEGTSAKLFYVFGAWIVVCFFLSLWVWSMAIQPVTVHNEPIMYFRDDNRDKIVGLIGYQPNRFEV